MDILGEKTTHEVIQELGSKAEALALVDENDNPYRNNI